MNAEQALIHFRLNRVNENLQLRTKQFALRILKVYLALPKRTDAQVLGKQLIRSGTSVGAHYREAARARSVAEFVSKLDVAQQEMEETIYWIELIIEHGLLTRQRLNDLLQEAGEVQAMLTASSRTAKKRLR